MNFVLQKNTTLKELYLGDNKIGPEVYLGDDKIGPEGGKAIAKALEVSPVFVSSFSFSCAVTLPLGNPT